MLKDRAALRPRAIPASAVVGIVVWLALTTPVPAQGPDVRQIPQAISVTVQEPERAPATTAERLRAAAEHVPVILFWAAMVGGVGLALWAVRRVIQAFPKRDFTQILFEDLSADREQRLDRNRRLAQSVISRLHNAQPLETFDLQIDVMPGATEPGFGGLQPVLTMAAVLDYERTDRPITIGAIEFSLRDVLTLVSQFFARPPEQYLEGWLIEDEGVVEVGAQMLDHRRRPKATRHRHRADRGAQSGMAAPLAWVVRGTNGRDRAITDLAAHILVDTGRSTLTSDWRSLRSFHEAMALRDDQRLHGVPEKVPMTVQARLSAARMHLAESVSYDASNWIARFSLAVTLCRDNEPMLALEHLAILEHAVARAARCIPDEWFQDSEDVRTWPPPGLSTSTGDEFDGPGFNELVRHLVLLPECAFLVLFNTGIAHATRKDDFKSLCMARDTFQRLSAWMPPESACDTPIARVVTFGAPYDAIARHVKQSRRTTLALYAMGAYASLIADTDDGAAGARLEDNPIAVLEELIDRIHADCRVRDAAHWPSALAARAIACAALGHVLLNRRQFRDARTHFENALAAEPRLVRALLGLAETYLEHAKDAAGSSLRKGAAVHEWLSRADALLDRATAINPGCAQGRYLRNEIRAYGFGAVGHQPS